MAIQPYLHLCQKKFVDHLTNTLSGDIPQLAKTIDAVLAWDQSHANALTPREKYRSEYDQIVSGLIHMRDEVVRKADSIHSSQISQEL
ncbi:MAG TPA: hypothetical protein VF207_03175 [Chthoniobacterales bacterium]